MSVGELWQRGQEGFPRGFPIVQFPNAPLLIAFSGWGVAAAAEGFAHDAGRAVFFLGLGVWAWQEAADGANWFRRVVGAGALVWIVVDLTGEL